MAHGTSRGDTAGLCSDDGLNGFGLLFNWSLLGDGTHQIRALADGQEFATVSFVVATFGVEFLRDAEGQFTFLGFPNAEDQLQLVWQESQQNFVIASDIESPQIGESSSIGVLENPQPGSFQSGLGVISGWVCEATRVEIEINGEAVFEAAYGTSRADTQAACQDSDNGFSLLFNWNLLGGGVHSIRALADGIEFGNATFVVTTFGTEILRGASGEFTIRDFPQAGTEVRVRWQESQQNFVIESVTELDPDSNRSLCRTQDGMGMDDLGQIAVFSFFNPCLLNGQTLLFDVEVPIQQGLAKTDGFSARTDNLSFRQGGQTFSSADFRWVDTAGNIVNTDIAGGNTLNTLLTVNPGVTLNFNEPFEVVYTQAMVAEFRLGIPCTAEPTDMDVEYGAIILCQIDTVGDSDLFRFFATAGDTVRLTLTDRTGGGASPRGQIFTPSGELLDNLTPVDAGASLQLTLAETGTYTILIREAGDNNTVTYNIALQRLFPTPVDPFPLCVGCVIEDERIDPVADTDVILFEATAGDTVRLTLTDRTGGGASPRGQIFTPSGELLDNLTPVDAGASLQLTLAETGTYTILIREAGDNNTVTYNIALQLLFSSS